MLHQQDRVTQSSKCPSHKMLAAAAQEYVARGWPVIPLSGKLPAIPWKEFQARLPTHEELEAWITSTGAPSGVGIVTGKLSGLVVVDCDRPEDACYWRREFPKSPIVVETGGGGVHFYYAMPQYAEIRNRAGVLFRKIDVRGEGGYATAPPSIHLCGRRYRFVEKDWEMELPVFDPDWIALRDLRSGHVFCNEETGRVKNAIAYIGKIRAVSGQGGHNATFRAACKLRDAGLSEEAAFSVLSDWNEANAAPPWSEGELRHKVQSAFRPRTK